MPSSELVPIPHLEWPELRDLFLNCWPENEVPFNAVQNCINWIGRDPKVRHLRILSLDGSWRKNGTFVLMDRHELYFFTLEQSLESLEQSLTLIDWDFSYRIVGILDRHQTVLEQVLSKWNILPSKEHLSNADLVVKLLKTDEVDAEVQPPSGFHLGCLEIHHAPYVNSYSDNPSDTTQYTIARYIAWNPSVALFDDESDQPVAWCLMNNLGIISMLQTDERYRRRGFGELVVKAMMVKLASLGMNARAAVTSTNTGSWKLFEKIGFRKKCVLYYTRFHVDRFMEWNLF